MKKFVTMMCLMLLVGLVASARDQVTRDAGKLPAEAREFIKAQFPGTGISYLKIENNLFRNNGYEVRLTDGTELEFNNKGEWTDIDCEPRAVPAGIIPEAIKKYMKENYARHRTVKIERGRKGYELTLENDLEVKFDPFGNFVRLSY